MEEFKQAVVALAVPLTTLGTWVTGILTPAAAAISIAWICFQWYHSAPMKERRERKRLEKQG
jgi:hypothetical protein